MKKILSYLMLFGVLFLVGFNKAFCIEKTISDYNYGISGKISISSFYEKMKVDSDYKSLIISNEKGIDVIYETSVLHIDITGKVVGLITVDDLNADGVKDIIYITNSNEDFYNLIAVNGSNADIIWKQKTSQDIYNESAGYIKQNASLYSIKKVNDSVAVIYDYDFDLYDINTGKKLFHYEEKDNIWDITEIPDINKDKVNDYVISNQLGQLKAFSGKNNKIIWDSLVTPNLKIYNEKVYTGKVNRNIWQVEFIDDALYVIGEDGTLYNINYKNGKVSNKLSIYDFDEELLNKYYNKNIYYPNRLNPISRNSYYYKMFEIIRLDNDRILVSAFMNKNLDASEEKVDITYEKPFFTLINLKDMTIEYKVTINDLGIYNTDVLESDSSFIIPTNIKDEKLIINSYDKLTGEENKKYEISIGNTFTVDSVKNIYFNKYDDKILLESKGNFSYIVNNDLNSIVKNNDSLSYSYILKNDNKELIIYYKTNEIINKIVKYSDYTNNTVAFEYNIPTDFKNNGLTSMNITHDFNGDGVKDLTALVNKLNDKNEVIASYFLILDMKNGNVISFKNMFLYSYKDENKKKVDVYLTGSTLYAVNDVNGDRKIDLVLDNNIINGSKFKVMGAITESVNESGKAIKVGDINNDGFVDFVNVLESQANLYISKESSNNVTYSKANNKYTYDKSLQNYDYVYKAPDINNDGINELIFNAKNENGLQYYVVVSGSDLRVICNLEKEGISESNSFGFLNFDANKDGYNEIYEVINWGSTANIISGKTGELLISFSLMNDEGLIYDSGGKLEGGVSQTIIPFYETQVDKSIIMGEDLNNDGNAELFYLKESYYPKQEITLNAFDIFNKNSEVVKTYLIKKIDNMGNMFYVDTYSYQVEEGDYFKKLIKINNANNLYIYKSQMLNKYAIYDIANETEISGFSSSIDSAYASDNKILGMYNNTPVVISYTNDFKIKDKSEKGSVLNLSWEYNETGGMNIVKIYDNNKYIKTSYSNNSKVLLPEGKHTILIEYIDKWGKTSNYTFDVNIEKSSDVIIVYTVVTLFAILLILYLSLVTKIRRKIAVRRAL